MSPAIKTRAKSRGAQRGVPHCPRVRQASPECHREAGHAKWQQESVRYTQFSYTSTFKPLACDDPFSSRNVTHPPYLGFLTNFPALQTPLAL